MSQYLEVTIWYIKDTEGYGEWEHIVITNRDHLPTIVRVEDDIVFGGGEMQPGLNWDTERIEQLLEPHIGMNSLGEAMFMNANETPCREGSYKLDGSECPDKIPKLVEWRIINYAETVAELSSAIQASQAIRPVLDHPADDVRYEKSYNRPNDKWRVTKYTLDPDDNTWMDDHIATLDTEALADLLIAVCQGVTVYIGVEQGLVEALTVPAILLHRIDAKVVDFDVQSNNPADINGGVVFTSEDGEQVVCSVLETTVRCGNGANNIDRAIQAAGG